MWVIWCLLIHYSPFINLFVLVSAKMSDYRLWARQMEPGRFRLVHNKMFHVRFGCASALCLFWLCITQTTSRVSSSSRLSAISIKADRNLSLCVGDKRRAQGQLCKRAQLSNTMTGEFQTGCEYGTAWVWVSEWVRRIEATSAGAGFHSEVDEDCTFIFQSSNQTTSPFSGMGWERAAGYRLRCSHWCISDPFRALM